MAQQFDPTKPGTPMAPGNAPTSSPMPASGSMSPTASVPSRSMPPATAGSGSGSATDVAKEQARSLKDRSADAAAAVGRQAGDELSGLRDEAMSDARHLAGEARDRVGVEADRAATEAAHALAGAALELTTMADNAEHPDSTVAEIVRRAGERTGSVARRLEERGSQGVVDDLSRFARNRPGLFLLGAGALGFAVGRMVRNTDTSSIVAATKSELTGSDGGGSDSSYADSSYALDGEAELDLRSTDPQFTQGPVAAGRPAQSADATNMAAGSGTTAGMTGMRRA